MLVKDLPKDADLTKVPIVIPDDIFEDNSYGGPPKKTVYLRSSWMRGLWVVLDPKATRVYPITEVSPSIVLEWKVDESYESSE